MGGIILTGVALLCLGPIGFVLLILLGFYHKKQLAEGPKKADEANGAVPTKAHAADLMSVLNSWGYSKKDANKMIEQAIMNNPESGFEDLLRYAQNGNKEK